MYILVCCIFVQSLLHGQFRPPRQLLTAAKECGSLPSAGSACAGAAPQSARRRPCLQTYKARCSSRARRTCSSTAGGRTAPSVGSAVRRRYSFSSAVLLPNTSARPPARASRSVRPAWPPARPPVSRVTRAVRRAQGRPGAPLAAQSSAQAGGAGAAPHLARPAGHCRGARIEARLPLGPPGALLRGASADCGFACRTRGQAVSNATFLQLRGRAELGEHSAPAMPAAPLRAGRCGKAEAAAGLGGGNAAVAPCASSVCRTFVACQLAQAPRAS